MVLVTGATGNNGVELTKLLAAQGVSVRAMVRSADRATAIAGVARVEMVEGDFDDSKSVERALNGVEKAFLLTNSFGTGGGSAMHVRGHRSPQRAGADRQALTARRR